MKADLYKTNEGWDFVPVEGHMAVLVGHDHEQALAYAVRRGCREITEWRDGKQFCTHFIPKQTPGKNECPII